MTTTNLDVANTILSQLGGNRFRAMTGAKDFIGSADSLSMRLPRGAKASINRVEIRLDPSDTYTVRFIKQGNARTAYKCTIVREVSYVYADSLREVFEAETGLYTSLGTMGR